MLLLAFNMFRDNVIPTSRKENDTYVNRGQISPSFIRLVIESAYPGESRGVD